VTRLQELARFGLVGGFNAATYFGLYTAGVLVGVPYLLSAFVSFLLSASLGYWLHEHWTFRGKQPTLSGWSRWLAAQGAATGFNLAGLAVAVGGLGVDEILAQAVLLPMTPVVTYLVGRRWVFSQVSG
jgi:putative flippase GtrA